MFSLAVNIVYFIRAPWHTASESAKLISRIFSLVYGSWTHLCCSQPKANEPVHMIINPGKNTHIITFIVFHHCIYFSSIQHHIVNFQVVSFRPVGLSVHRWNTTLSEVVCFTEDSEQTRKTGSFSTGNPEVSKLVWTRPEAQIKQGGDAVFTLSLGLLCVSVCWRKLFLTTVIICLLVWALSGFVCFSVCGRSWCRPTLWVQWHEIRGCDDGSIKRA